MLSCELLSFFFQAEDGIRDRNVTGVQTCALPIFKGEVTKIEVDLDANTRPAAAPKTQRIAPDVLRDVTPQPPDLAKARREKRSEERRVGKECRTRGSPYQ